MATGALIDRRQLGASIRREFYGRIKALAGEAEEAGDTCDHKLSAATAYFGDLWGRGGAYRVGASLREAIAMCDDVGLKARIQWLEAALADARRGPDRAHWSFDLFKASHPM